MKKNDTYDGSERLANARQEAFAQAYVFALDDKDRFDAVAAYRKAGYKAVDDETCRTAAARLLRNDTVSLRVKFLMDLADKEITRDRLKFRNKNLQRLDGIADSETMNGMIRVAAMREINVMLGLKAPDKHEVTGAQGTPLIRTEAEVEKRVQELQKMLEKCR